MSPIRVIPEAIITIQIWSVIMLVKKCRGLLNIQSCKHRTYKTQREASPHKTEAGSKAGYILHKH